MPVDDARTEVIGHRLALDDFAGVVMFEGEGIFGFRTFVGILLISGNAGFISVKADCLAKSGGTKAIRLNRAAFFSSVFQLSLTGRGQMVGQHLRAYYRAHITQSRVQMIDLANSSLLRLVRKDDFLPPEISQAATIRPL